MAKQRKQKINKNHISSQRFKSDNQSQQLSFWINNFRHQLLKIDPTFFGLVFASWSKQKKSFNDNFHSSALNPVFPLDINNEQKLWQRKYNNACREIEKFTSSSSLMTSHQNSIWIEDDISALTNSLFFLHQSISSFFNSPQHLFFLDQAACSKKNIAPLVKDNLCFYINEQEQNLSKTEKLIIKTRTKGKSLYILIPLLIVLCIALICFALFY